jgi:serine/threonine-protein kinase RsbW
MGFQLEQNLEKMQIIHKTAELQSLGTFRDFIDTVCETHTQVDEQTLFDLKLAIDEACTNIILHGYAGIDSGTIMLGCEVDNHRAVILISDFGRPFEHGERSKPDIESILETNRTGGFGLYFIYQTMDEVSYETDDNGNRLTLVKKLKRRRESEKIKHGDQFRTEN